MEALGSPSPRQQENALGPEQEALEDSPVASAVTSNARTLADVGRRMVLISNIASNWQVVHMPFGEIMMTRLMRSCAKGDLKTLKAELTDLAGEPERLASELAASDDWAGSKPLHWAAYSGVAACVLMMLEHGADPRSKNRRDSSMPIHLAARYGQPDVLAALVDAAPDTLLAQNGRGNTPLHESAAENRLAAVRFILERARQLDGTLSLTPSAVDQAGSTVSVHTLLRVATPPEEGAATPLHAAVEFGHTQAVRLLVEARADLRTAVYAGGFSEASSSVYHRQPKVRPLGRSSSSRLPARPLARTLSTPEVSCKARARAKWAIPGHGAISLALAAGHRNRPRHLSNAVDL